MSETAWILWIVEASNGKYGKIAHVYARDEAHARERVGNWLEAHAHLPRVRFTAHPNGFQIVTRWLPGMIRVEEKVTE